MYLLQIICMVSLLATNVDTIKVNRNSNFVYPVCILPMSHRLMACTMSVRCEPVESEPRCMSSQNWIKCWTSFSNLQSKTWPRWTGRSRLCRWRCIPGHIFFRMVQWCIRLTHSTLLCEVIRYSLLQVWQNPSHLYMSGWRPFSIPSSFVLFFILPLFFLK